MLMSLGRLVGGTASGTEGGGIKRGRAERCHSARIAWCTRALHAWVRAKPHCIWLSDPAPAGTSLSLARRKSWRTGSGGWCALRTCRS